MIYLDNSATTKPCLKAIEYMTEALQNNWGNPSSLHSLGINAEEVLNNARIAAAKLVGAVSDEIIFTSGGTEANNTCIFSAASNIKRGNRIITSAIEHPSVLEAALKLEKMGFEVIKIPCDNQGKISLSALSEALNEKTVLVSIMLVNNEIGSVQPIAEAVKLTRKLAPLALFHCDAVQAVGKIPVNVKSLGVDMLSVSGHKFHGPKGVGFIYCKKGVRLTPFINGGGQERGLRSGTEAVPAIAGLLGAIQELKDITGSYKKIADLNGYSRSAFKDSGIIEINSPADCLPYILNISVVGYRSETLLHFLEREDIFVSSGSACAKGKSSYVLEALGLSPTLSDSALRLSFSKETTKEDIDALLSALQKAVLSLRRSNI